MGQPYVEDLGLGAPAARARRSRSFHAGLGFLAVMGLVFVTSLVHPVRCHNPASRLYSHVRFAGTIRDRVHKILSETPLIDGHNDFAIFIRSTFGNHIYGANFTEPFENGGLPMHVDLPRLRESQNGGAFWSVYVPCPANGTDFSDENYAESVQMTYDQIDVMQRLQEAYPTEFSEITGITSEAARAAFASGRLISPLGVEGLHQIGNRAANLRHYHARGARYVTLTHNCGNAFADAAIREDPFGVAPPFWGGVSPRGRALIREMNRLGVAVDLSHVSADTMRDVLGAGDDDDAWEGSLAPVMFSHSSAYALCPHPRNVPDDVLQLVKKTNSIVMVNFAPDFISCVDNGNENGIPDFYPENSTLAQVARHVTYIGDLVGYDHVGLGSDFDGIGSTPAGLEDVSKFPDLVAELLDRGVSDEDAAKIVGGNILRVWKDVEDVAAKLQAEGEPVLEDDLPSLW